MVSANKTKIWVDNLIVQFGSESYHSYKMQSNKNLDVEAGAKIKRWSLIHELTRVSGALLGTDKRWVARSRGLLIQFKPLECNWQVSKETQKPHRSNL